MLFLFVLFVFAFSLKSADHIVCLRNNDHEVGTTTAILPSELDFATKKFPFMCDNACPCVCESVSPLEYTNSTRIEGNVLSVSFHHTMPRALRVDAYWNHGGLETYFIENDVLPGLRPWDLAFAAEQGLSLPKTMAVSHILIPRESCRGMLVLSSLRSAARKRPLKFRWLPPKKTK